MKCVYLLVFVLSIQLFAVQAGKSSESRSERKKNSSNDSSGSSGSSNSDSSASNDSSNSSDSNNSSHKKKSKKAKNEVNNTQTKPDKNQCGIETILKGLPKPLDDVAVSTKISINSILSSLINIKSQTGALSILGQQIVPIFEILSKVTGVASLNSSFESIFDKIKLTFSSFEFALGISVVDTAKHTTVAIQETLSSLITLISSKSGSSDVTNINNFVREIAENIQVLISLIEATITTAVAETTSAFNTDIFAAIISLQIVTAPILYLVQWVLSLTAYTSLSVNGKISPDLSSLTLAMTTILQNISKIMVTISNPASSTFSKTVNLIVSPVTKLSSSVNASLSPISGTVIQVKITSEQVTSNSEAARAARNY